MSTQPTTPELHPDDLANLPAGVSLGNVPDFEKPTAANTTIQKGNLDPDETIAHEGTPIPLNATQEGSSYNPSNLKNTVYVDDPKSMDQGTLNHEVLHAIQEAQNVRSWQAGLEGRGNTFIRPSSKDSYANYDYGGVAGLLHRLGKGQSLSSLGDEQQAEMLKDYTNKMQEIAGRKDSSAASEFDQYKQAYGPFIRQMAEMARPGNTLNTTPQPPGPPPASLTGSAKPLPEIGGRTIELHTEDLANHPKQIGKGKK